MFFVFVATVTVISTREAPIRGADSSGCGQLNSRDCFSFWHVPGRDVSGVIVKFAEDANALRQAGDGFVRSHT